MIRLILKNSFIYGVVPQLSKIASFFVLPFITPFLTPTDYGVIGILDVYIGLISAIHFLGFNVVITNSFINYPNRYKILWRQLYGFLLLWSLIYVFLLGLLIYFVLPYEAENNINEILVIKLLPEVVITPIVLFMTIYYRMMQLAFPIALRSLLAGLIAVALNYYFIAELKLGFMGWLYAGFISTVVGGVFFVYPFFAKLGMWPIFNFKKRLIVSALKVGLPVIPHNYSHYLLNSSDRFVMERSGVSTADIGLYSLSYTLGQYINLIANAVNQAISPNMLIFIKEGKWKSYQDLVVLFQGIVYLSCFMAALWVNNWMPVLIRNEELNEYPEIFIIIAFSYSSWPLYSGCNKVLFYFEKTSVLWKITTIAGILNLGLNLVLIPRYGFVVAAWTTFFAMLYQSFSGFFFKHYREQNKSSLDPVFWFIMVVLGLTTILAVYELSTMVRTLVSLIILGIVVFYTFKKVNLKFS